MTKKAKLLSAVIAGVALAIPALAGAQPATDPAGTLVPINAKVEYTSTNATVQTSLGTIKCAAWTYTYQVTINEPAHYKASNAGTSTASTCSIGGSPITITDLTSPEIDSTASGKGTISLTFKADLPAGITCHFAGTVPFTYTPGSSVISVNNGNLTGTPAACEPGTFSGAWTIETDATNTDIILD